MPTCIGGLIGALVGGIVGERVGEWTIGPDGGGLDDILREGAVR